MSRIKYPRTMHLPFSLGRSSDDKVLDNLENFVHKHVVVTVKMDGENTTLYRDGFHARSIDSRHHPSRDWLARFHGEISWMIPEGWRICGENVYAQHSIAYDALPSYFLGFSIWDDQNRCLDWNYTLKFFDDIGITPVEELYNGPFNLAVLENMARTFDTDTQEGFVVRNSDCFNYDDFNTNVAKWVREKHVQTDQHWMHSSVIPNKIKF